MKYKKKGFTLLEVLVNISISTVVILIATNVLIDTVNIYYNNLNRNVEINSIVEGFISIDSIAKDDDMKEIMFLDDSVKFYYKNSEGQMIKELIKDNNDLIIRYYKMGGKVYYPYGPHNDIITNIEEFKVIKKEKLIYINVKKGGEIYTKCI